MLNWICPKCGTKKFLSDKQERERGRCHSCEVASWTQEKRDAFSALLREFVRTGDASQETLDKAIRAST